MPTSSEFQGTFATSFSKLSQFLRMFRQSVLGEQNCFALWKLVARIQKCCGNFELQIGMNNTHAPMFSTACLMPASINHLIKAYIYSFKMLALHTYICTKRLKISLAEKIWNSIFQGILTTNIGHYTAQTTKALIAFLSKICCYILCRYVCMKRASLHPKSSFNFQLTHCVLRLKIQSLAFTFI